MDGGGQMTEMAVPARTGTADVAMLTWPAVRDATAGGGPPLQFGEAVQALAAVAVSVSEPTVRDAEIITPAATRLIQAFGMTRILRSRRH
jgi:hypothetical protein